MKKILIPGLILAAYMGMLVTLSIARILPNNNPGLALILIPTHFIIFFLLLRWIKKKFYSNEMTFKEVFTNGIILGLFSVVLVSLCVFVFLSYIDPSAMETIKQIQEESKQRLIDTQGTLPGSVEKIYDTFLTPAMQALSTFFFLLFWILFSLISAAILKSKKP